MYADFSYYRDVYQGTLFTDTTAYAAFGRQAAVVLDQLTFGRIDTGWSQTEAVKVAACAVADKLKQQETSSQQAAAGAVLQSESVGKLSRTFRDPDVAQKALEQALAQTAGVYLMRTGLLDRSVVCQ